MYWTRQAIEELDRQRAKYGLIGDQPLMFLTEGMVAEEGGREVHVADVREAGDKHGLNITTMGYEKAK